MKIAAQVTILAIAIQGFLWLDQVSAQEGTPEQRSACQGDAFRLCSNFIPDADRITACLRQNEARLSKECRAVFSADPTGAQGLHDSARNKALR